MVEEIKVSIIVPSYKRERSLVERAIRSLLSQTYTNVEVVLVDDNARQDLRDYRNQIRAMVEDIKDERLLYVVNEKNLGGAGARNEGIKVCSGQYVTFLDDDDLYLPEKVEKQLQFMLDNSLDVSFGKLNLYNEADKLIDVREHDIKSYDLGYLKKYHLTKQITGTPTFMVKKQLLVDVGGFEIVPMGQEYYLMQKLLNGGEHKFGYFNECYIKAYRTKAEAISTGKNKITGEKALYKYKKTFFNLLNFKERQYVKCRHYAVMAVAYKRNGMFFKAICSLFVSVACAPITVMKEALGLRKRKKNSNHE